ncbi:helix-turn-helix domain-containing protein [Bacillus thuringiensis]|nr:helix-turn-helix domain-containing protein [Bacillus thuringiensis]
MRSILNKNLLRNLNTLEFLYENSDWITIGHIAKSLRCSEKILKQDIKLINGEFSPLKIETSRKGIKLTYPSNYSAEFIYQKILSLSPEFSFIERIFFKENYTIETLAEELFVSVSTLRRIIIKLKRYFKKIKINITINTNPCQIVGSEVTIRNFIIHFFYEKYGAIKSPFPTIQVKVLDQILLFTSKKNNIELNFPDLTRLRYWVMVGIVRLKNNHFLDMTESLPENIDSSILDNKTLCILFKKFFGFELTREVIYQLGYVFLNKHFALNYEQLELMIQNKTTNAWIIVPQLKKFLSSISSKLNIPIQNEEKILLELYNTIFVIYLIDYTDR